MTEILSSHKNGYVEVIAEEEGQRIGRTVSINVGDTALLEEFHVERSHRGLGVGSELMEMTEKLAEKDGAKRMIRTGLFCDAPSIGEYLQTTKFLNKRGFHNFGVVLSKNLSCNS